MITIYLWFHLLDRGETISIFFAYYVKKITGLLNTRKKVFYGFDEKTVGGSDCQCYC